MALKDDARSVANDASDLLTDLNVLSERLIKLVDRASGIADLVPSPEEARTYVVPEGFVLVAKPVIPDMPYTGYGVREPRGAHFRAATGRVFNDDDFSALADDAEQYTLMPRGRKVFRRDRHGVKLRSGDRVQVFGSDRYGNPYGTVIGPGPDPDGPDDGKDRVLIKLDDGQDDRYTPSTGRIQRVARWDEDVVDAEVQDEQDTTVNVGEEPVPRMIIGCDAGNGLHIGVEVPEAIARTLRDAGITS